MDPNTHGKKPEDDDNGKNQHKSVVTVRARNDEPMAKIFKLNVDCFEEVFDYLSRKDLTSIANTCTRLQQIAGHCFRTNYPTFSMIYFNNRLNVGTDRMACLNQFCHKICVVNGGYDYKLPCLRNIQPDQYKSLNKIEFSNLKINSTEGIEFLSDILGKVNSIKFYFCEMDGEVFATIIENCKNLQILQLQGCRTYAKKALRIAYPHLEQFEFKPIITDETFDELNGFFELNPNIRKFTIDSHFLLKNYQSLINLNVKLDTLAITFNAHRDLNVVCDILQKLNDREFFKQVHFECKLSLDQTYFDHISTLESLTKLNILVSYMQEIVTIPRLRGLEEFSIYDSDRILEWDDIPQNLANLRRISFSRSSYDVIFRLIGNAVKLKSIVIDHFIKKCDQYKKLVIDLAPLNKERQKLAGAQTVTIYVSEDTYLATKWAMKRTDFNLVRIERIDSYQQTE